MPGRGRGQDYQARRNRGSTAVQVPPIRQSFQEAQALQQQAERRKGAAEALQLLGRAVEKYEEVLQLQGEGQEQGQLSQDDMSEAWFGLGECLQKWAEGVLEASQQLPDSECTPAAEGQAKEFAVQLLQRAVEALRQVGGGPDACMRDDAAVSCGNALAEWAGLVDPEAARKLLVDAESSYRMALQQEEDALTYSNLADTLIQHAELEAEAGFAEAAEQLYEQAQGTYHAACSRSHAEEGDDLPGLLYNWGVGLYSRAMATPADRTGPGPSRVALLEEAAQRLRESISFNRGDPAPLNALGDVLLAAAEQAADSATAVQRLQSALQEGFQGALAIHAANVDGLVGSGEVHAELAKVAGDAAVRAQHAQLSCTAYHTALSQPQLLRGFQGRCNVRYNYACALLLAGRCIEAAQVFQELLSRGGVSVKELQEDEELVAYRQHDWFLKLAASTPACTS